MSTLFEKPPEDTAVPRIIGGGVIAFATMAVLSLMWWTLSPFLGRVYTGVRLAESLILWKFTGWGSYFTSVPAGQPFVFLSIYKSSVGFGLVATALTVLIGFFAWRKRSREHIEVVNTAPSKKYGMAEIGGGAKRWARPSKEAEGEEVGAGAGPDLLALGLLGRTCPPLRAAADFGHPVLLGRRRIDDLDVFPAPFAPGEEPDQHRQRRGDEAEPDARFVDREEHERLPGRHAREVAAPARELPQDQALGEANAGVDPPQERGQGPPHQAEDRHRGEGDDAAADDTGDGRILGRLLEQRAHIPRPTCGPSRPSVCCWASAVCN